MGLQQFEERLGRLMEGTLARPFRKSLQPVDIARKLTREMDLNRRVAARGLLAPNHFAIHVSPADGARFSSFVDALARELVTTAKEHAATESYSFMGNVAVEFFEDLDLKAGNCDVEGTFAEITINAAILDGSGGKHLIGDEPFVIGRLQGCDLVLGDTNVSRRHVSVTRVGDRFVATDLQSTNGTLLNGKKITEVALSNNDELTVGSTKLTIEIA